MSDRYVDPADEQAVERAIEAWHDGHGEGLELHQYLGWTWEQYKAWMQPVPIDPLDVLLGIDPTDPAQALAADLVAHDTQLMQDLVAARTQQGLSLTAVAERMGCTPHAVAMLERPAADPCLSTLRRYALAVGARLETVVKTQMVGW